MQTAEGYVQTTFRKCANNVKGGGRNGQAENVQLGVDDHWEAESKGARSERLRG